MAIEWISVKFSKFIREFTIIAKTHREIVNFPVI